MSSENPVTLADIQRDLARLGSIGYAEDDIRALLNHTGASLLGYLRDTIGNQYRKSFTNKWDVPSAKLWPPVSLKAYNELIPICQQWLADLKQARDLLDKEVNRATDT